MSTEARLPSTRRFEQFSVSSPTSGLLVSCNRALVACFKRASATPHESICDRTICSEAKVFAWLTRAALRFAHFGRPCCIRHFCTLRAAAGGPPRSNAPGLKRAVDGGISLCMAKKTFARLLRSQQKESRSGEIDKLNNSATEVRDGALLVRCWARTVGSI
jgi:hypothetical protein